MPDKRSISLLSTYLATLSTVGLGLSIYSYYVEARVELEDDYTAMCDINEHISCSKVFKSPYGKGFGFFPEDSIFHVPNSIFGIPFYSLMIVLAYSPSVAITKFVFANVLLSNCLTPYLAYLLYFVLQDVCVVCVTVYVVNALSLFVSYKKLLLLTSSVEKSERPAKKRN
ncbi:vitamin K epoxide reductase complex subunit 1-like protein 1 [Coccinella septempunctata]|uniref:vitamin K epoxide reductase complex subunit 1-like protein 1 n=1 Tax=Coccinella septempunctata TaxID=41139 RepID=UPI001D08D1BD|nr:vitamin K epoxide reductase complex subunit 1-like protein 1 [Coccinella septempunctata]